MTAADATATGLHAQADLAPGTVIAGRFRIEGLLGVGGMGVVYRAVDQALDVPVALKLLRPELAHRVGAFERFRQELLLARQVSSPHVVRIHDLVQHEGRWLIGMDFIDGEALDHRLDRDGALDVEDALRIARQVADGLRAAHLKGVVHRDLKPANVLIDRDGNAYISDFGVARSLMTSGLTQSGAVVGTPDYLSPEQVRGDPVDLRSDLYALGLILYEMLTGAMPFSGGTLAEVLGQRIARAPKPVTMHRPDLPPWVARLVDRLLRTQPAHRLQTAAAVVEAIDRRHVARSWMPSRRAWAAGIAATLVTAIGVGAWWSATSRDGTTTTNASSAIAATAPLQRLLVVPRFDGAPVPAALAASDLLREHLADTGTVVVDGERARQALRQLDPAGAGRVDTAALARVAGADRVLMLDWGRDARTLSAELHARGATERIDGSASTGADASAVVASAWPRIATALGVANASPPSLPEREALVAHGDALLAHAAGDLGGAYRAQTRAASAAPADPRLRLAQASAAQRVGDDDAAYAALEAAAITPATPARLRHRVAAARALLEGDAAAALAQWQALAAPVDDTEAALLRARALGAAGDHAAAIASLQALVGRDGGDPRAWFELGKFSILQGDARDAVDEHLLRALVLFKRSRDVYGEAETVNALGVGYGRLGQTADSEEQYRKAVALRRALGNRRGVATSLRNLASVVSLRGAFDEAGAHLDAARRLYVEMGDSAGLAATDGELGLLAEERGDFRGALAAYRRALQAHQEAGSEYDTAETLNHVGFAHLQLGDYASAQAFWQQAAAAYAKLGDATGAVRTTQNLGLLDIARGDWIEARRRLQASLTQAEGRQMVEEAAVSRRNLAELDAWEGRYGDALAQAQRAMTLFRQREDLRGATDAGLLRVQALHAMQAHAAARVELDALAEELEEASTEQRAMAAALDGALLRAAGRDGTARFAEATRLADGSGARQLQVHVALLRDAPGTPTLDAETRALGHRALRLLWLEGAMDAALARGDRPAAAALYRDATGLLRGLRYANAFRLHALGARALAGDAAARAAELAASTLRAVRTDVPAAHVAAFDRMPAVRTLAAAPAGGTASR